MGVGSVSHMRYIPRPCPTAPRHDPKTALIAHRSGWISRKQVELLAQPMLKNNSGPHRVKIANESVC